MSIRLPISFGLCALLTAIAAGAAADDGNVDLPPTLMTERGRLLLREDFAKPVVLCSVSALFDGVIGVVDRDPRFLQHPDGWLLHPGKWEFVDGGIRGSMAEHHGPIAAYAIGLTNTVCQFDVRLDGARQAFCRFNDAVDHVCRVMITADGFSAQKDDHDHDGPDLAVPFGTVALPIRRGEWKTVLVEIQGDELVATVDGRSVAGSDPLLRTLKATIAFGVSGTSASFRHLRIWEAKPHPAWAERRRALSTNR